ncbi:tail fiber assembly protein [Billgrantia aerodenitrificans]|uniref:DUF4376 domain-containing protein n=1 Tax=Billgrantia aerodenitrificans TaxID=2733483 RepID=A0ABS9APB5_9GAMM|nr:DUF4376 domain-containing protein [Halomonas aerodenitrificans]MCE8023668.1 DUF4376 domain-containing protein [Halomonas aerodenitrificans]
MYYSSHKNAFYPATVRDDYESSGKWPDDAIKVTDQEWKIYGQGEPPKGMRRGADEHGRPAWVPIPPPDLETLAARKRQEIDAERDRAFAAGLPYKIAGHDDVVQTRPQDQINLLGLSAKAQRLLAAGDTETTFTFRGLSNVNRTLTAEQMDALALAALEHIEQIYGRSWLRKDAIDAALEDENLDDDAKRAAIEAVTW